MPRVACTVTRLKHNRECVAKTETADELSAAIKDIYSKAFTQSIEGEGRNDKVLSKGKHLYHKFIGFLLMQNLMLECRHLGFCR